MIKDIKESNNDIVLLNNIDSNTLINKLSKYDITATYKGEKFVYSQFELPQEKEVTFEFIKYYDDNDRVSSVNFNNVRVLKKYYDLSSTDEEIEQAIANAIANESIQIYVQ